MRKLRQALTHAPRHSTIAAYTALVLSITGTAYAAVNLPAGSVGPRQIRNGAVTPAKLNAKIGAYVRAWAVISPDGHVFASHPRAHTSGYGAGGGQVSWEGLRRRPNCFPLATTEDGGASVAVGGPLDKLDVTTVNPATGQAAPADVAIAVFCAP